MRRRKSAEGSAAGHQYPRMQLRRVNWINLNGSWDFTIDADATLSSPTQVRFAHQITVPFAPESPASGIGQTGFFKAVWYRRSFATPKLREGERLILHFGAVDHQASIWVNESLAVRHEGGYTPFEADITDLLTDSGNQTIIVRAFDNPHDLAKPRGKQDWQLEPHSIWYPRTTGIWQTVWMEIVPSAHIAALKWTANVERWAIDLDARVGGIVSENMRLRVRLHSRGKTLAEDAYSLSSNEVRRTISLPDPGIDDLRNDLLWHPDSPNLIDAELELLDANEKIVDSVTSYTAMRSVGIERNKFILNGRPIGLRLMLDQGYWPNSGLTAPDDDALRRDVELVKSLGFNGVRKHQKIEDPRFLYWADKLGLLVWEEMPSPYSFTNESVRRLTAEWMKVIERDASHPCIIAWVPFNESWGVPDLPRVAAQRDFLRGIYRLTKALDPTRPVIGNDGWEMIETDIIAIHDYEHSPQRLMERYERSDENVASLFANTQPASRQLLLDGCETTGRPIMLTEFGGIAYHKDVKHTWGYRRASTAADFTKQYTDVLAAVRSLPLFGGFCYTQFTDTYQEANGLLYMDRTPKIPVAKIAKATNG